MIAQQVGPSGPLAFPMISSSNEGGTCTFIHPATSQISLSCLQMHPNTTSSLLEVGPIPSSSHSIAHSPLSGGTAACVAAGRLAAADPSLKILILEAGPTTYNNLAHIQPARYLSHLAPDSTTVTHNIAKPSTHLGGRAVVVSSGHCLGGGSSVNCETSKLPHNCRC